MAADAHLAAILARAQREVREGGRVTAASAQALVAAVMGESEPEPSRSGPHDARLGDRDDCIRQLAGLADGSTWARAGVVAGWLRRWCAGDSLHDIHRDALRLVSMVGAPLSQRQVFRILSGDRSR